MTRIVVSGAAGRMGRTLIRLLDESHELELVGGVEAPDHPVLGTDCGLLAGIGTTGISAADSLPKEFDVLIDFSQPEGSVEHVEASAAIGARCVIGTTGFSAEQHQRIAAAGGKTAIVISPNMSVGVNVLFREAVAIARMLGSDYDIEIVEAHHRFKKDAPSGTALRVAEEIAIATGRRLDQIAVYGRRPGEPARQLGEIGVHAVRGGDIVGEHTVYYVGLGERLELKHVAHSRETFARGALRAAQWVVGRGPGLYSMAQVLGG